jgi:hypothetical protein
LTGAVARMATTPRRDASTSPENDGGPPA